MNDLVGRATGSPPRGARAQPHRAPPPASPLDPAVLREAGQGAPVYHLHTFLGEEGPPAGAQPTAGAPPWRQLRQKLQDAVADRMGADGAMSHHFIARGAARPCDGDLYAFLGEDGEGGAAEATFGVNGGKQRRLYGGLGAVWYNLATTLPQCRDRARAEEPAPEAGDPGCEYHRMDDPGGASPPRFEAPAQMAERCIAFGARADDSYRELGGSVFGAPADDSYRELGGLRPSGDAARGGQAAWMPPASEARR